MISCFIAFAIVLILDFLYCKFCVRNISWRHRFHHADWLSGQWSACVSYCAFQTWVFWNLSSTLNVNSWTTKLQHKVRIAWKTYITSNFPHGTVCQTDGRTDEVQCSMWLLLEDCIKPSSSRLVRGTVIHSPHEAILALLSHTRPLHNIPYCWEQFMQHGHSRLLMRFIHAAAAWSCFTCPLVYL